MDTEILRKVTPGFVRKPLKKLYTSINFYTYNDLYKYHTIYIAAGNRTASTWLKDVLARLLDGFSSHHPRNHPDGEKGGNYDIYDVQ